MTRFTISEERGLSANNILAGEAAPIYFTRKDVCPMLIIMEDDDWPACLEGNEYFVSTKYAGNASVRLEVVKDRGHGNIIERTVELNDPCANLVRQYLTDRGGFSSATSRKF